MIKFLGYIALGFVTLFIFMQIRIRIGMFMMKGKPAPQPDGEAGDMIKQGQKVLLLFHSPMCSACQPMVPVAEKMKEEGKPVYLFDISKQRDLIQKFSIAGTPTSVLIEDGKIKKFVVGYRPESSFRKLFDE